MSIASSFCADMNLKIVEEALRIAIDKIKHASDGTFVNADLAIDAINEALKDCQEHITE